MPVWAAWARKRTRPRLAADVPVPGSERPIFYNLFIIVGGVIGARRFGIASLAYGALFGAFVGPFLINAIGAARDGLTYQFNFDWHNPEFREWVKLSIPLMLGVSLVSADDWILRYFASGGTGDITRLNYAKRLFAVPISILGQATGQASMPFFAHSLAKAGARTSPTRSTGPCIASQRRRFYRLRG